ncbi:Major Facilitator Superfamily (MFS), partial [Thraustotheca clavata]
FSVQFCTGSIYALLSLANPINVFFQFEAHSTNATNLLLEAGIISSASQALIGPFLERKGPRTSLAWSTLLLAIGLLLAQLACTIKSWTLLHIGFDIMGIALSAILLCSISTTLKWCPDLRGTVTGICLLGYGVGVGVWRVAFHALLDKSDSALSYLFTLLFAALIPILIIATVNGYDMHCIPSNNAPDVNIVQDDYLRVGMTLINYRAICRCSSDAIEGTDRHYHEQVKALTLTQCILSADFFCLYIAFAANGLVGLLYGKLTATQLSHDLLVDWYGISSAYADAVRFRGIIADLTGRVVFPVISDLCIRLFYANPA